MNEHIIKLGLESGMLNYIDNETPRHYFLCGLADERCLEKFAQLIIQECVKSVNCYEALNILDRFGIDSENFGVES